MLRQAQSEAAATKQLVEANSIEESAVCALVVLESTPAVQEAKLAELKAVQEAQSANAAQAGP